MATTEAFSDSQEGLNGAGKDDFQYRPISTGAIASAIFGVLSLLMFVAGGDSLQACLMLSPIPLVGLTVGLKSLATIRSMPDQLSGRKAGLAGVVLSAVGLFGGVSYAGYIHATEVPEGYARTSFLAFRPDEVDERRGAMIPSDIQELDGKKVFIKGYIRPGTTVTKNGTPVRQQAWRFLLVRDNNECCFGDQSKVKYYDQILASMADGMTMNDSRRLQRVGGTLRILPEHLRGPGRPVYLLEADYLQ
ncbi:MAG: DUF4190 domain-containing protein [Planctomycetes bacterium]|nr:DUF4190 domain-containing protein [Planctomycetota bacterium]